MKKIYPLFLECDSISTDTRNIALNSMFFVLKGDNFNGNKFAEIAIEKGAKYAIVDEIDRKSTRLNSSHVATSYAAFCSLNKDPTSHGRQRLERRSAAVQ